MVLKLMLKERTERRAFLREYCIARCLSGHAACIHALPLAFENSTHFAFGQELAPAGDLCNLLTPGVCVSQGWGAQQWAGEEKGLGKGCSGYREEVGTKRTLQQCEITGRMCVHGEALCNREHVCVMHGDIICSELCTYGVHGETLHKGPHAHALHRDILCSRVHAYGFPEEVLCSGLHSHVFFSMVHAHTVHGNTQCVACTPFAVECELMWCTRSPIMVPSGVCYGVCPMLVVPGRDLGSAAAPPREVTLLSSPGGSA